MFRSILTCLLGLLFVAAARGAEPQALFNGKDLTGWSGNPEIWSVQEGAIVGSTVGKKIAGNTFLVWDGGEVEDFHLKFEARVVGNNNSGVQYRSKLADPKTWRVIGYQADIHPAPNYVGMLYGEGLGRGIIAERGTKVRVDAETGKPEVIAKEEQLAPVDISQWTTYEIEVRGDRLIHKVDGKVAVEVTDQHGDKLRRGILALQVHAGPEMTVYFRNLQLTRHAAPSTDDQSGWVDLLPGGKFAEHWTTKGNWQPDEDGAVTLTPREGETGWSRFDAYLWSKKEYGDFELEVEFKLQKNGNSGFYFNVGDATSPVAKGIEVQIYDSHGKPDSAKLTDHDCGGIIPAFPPTKRVSNPAGEWNKFHITSQNRQLTVRLNGHVVNQVDLNDSKLGGRPPRGLLGFQDHGLPLSLRNIRVREL